MALPDEANYPACDTDREFRASFDREGGATCLGQVGCREIGAHDDGARHAVECAE